MSRRLPRPAGYHWDQAEMVARPDGLKACRWCKGPVQPPKRTFCGNPECLRQWQMRTTPRVLRQVIYDRDRGVCQNCGLDTGPFDLPLIRDQIYLAGCWFASESPQKRKNLRPRIVTGPGGLIRPPQYWAGLVAPAIDWCMANKVPLDETPWQVDHITPLILGGAAFDLANLRTLCVPCHRLETKALNIRLAAERRARAELELLARV